MNPCLFAETDSLSPRTFASKSARIGPRGPRSAASAAPPASRSAPSCGRGPPDDVGLSLGSRGAGDQGPSGGRLGRSGRLFGVELDDPPRRTPL